MRAADGANGPQPLSPLPLGFIAMTDLATHIAFLFAAELQFRLASTVRLAVTMDNQPLDLPEKWSHGKHNARFKDVALRKDQADFAARNMPRSATFLMTPIPKDIYYQQDDLILKRVKKFDEIE